MKYRNERIVRNLSDGKTVSCFTPCLFRLLPQNCGTLKTERHIRLRFLYRFLVGYRIYMLRDGEDFLAYAMFQKGKIARYPFVEKGMYMMGPYFVDEGHRGHALGGTLLSVAVEDVGEFKSIYAWILVDNQPSRRTVTKVGFRQCGYLDSSKIIRSVTQTPTGCQVWRLDK
ncbi:MAG: GNAT family N-acetyltransferase [Eubacteriales bacterium]|nr:GNAT family N-acetyltransferase [Eubacteriales bacterium]